MIPTSGGTLDKIPTLGGNLNMLERQQKRHRRHKKVRAKVSGTAERPRLCVFRSKNHIYAQLIDDEKGRTLMGASEREIKPKTKIPTSAKATAGKQKYPAKLEISSPKANKLKIKSEGKKLEEKETEIVRTGKVAIAFEVGNLIAQKALEKKIERVVFDRGGYKYHGRIKALAEGAREAGLKF